MRFSPSSPAKARRAFTLAEVLAAMLVMAIVIPVVLQGLSVASRAGTLGTRKAAAMRVAERVLNEQFVTGQLTQAQGGGTVAEGDTTYRWTLESGTWPQDAMTQVTVHVTFTVQGTDYEVSAGTLYDPASIGTTVASNSTR